MIIRQSPFHNGDEVVTSGGARDPAEACFSDLRINRPLPRVESGPAVASIRGMALASRSCFLLLLVPLLPGLTVGGVEAKQGAELGVGLLRRGAMQVALDQQRPRLEQLRVESDRFAACRHRPGP